jgi:hypothetical protein
MVNAQSRSRFDHRDQVFFLAKSLGQERTVDGLLEHARAVTHSDRGGNQARKDHGHG